MIYLKIRCVSTLFALLFFSSSLQAQRNTKTISKEELYSKIYASWVGQFVGNIYGLPHENAYIDKPGPNNFPYGYGENIDMLKEHNGAFSDDDTDFEYMYLIQMDKAGVEPTYGQLTQAWKYHVRDRVWLANRAALSSMHFGFKPPATGKKEFNPHWFQIDPQLINEIWGVTAPGMVKYASDKSAWAARITNDDWGIEPTIHFGAMYAAAFFETDVKQIIEIGTQALPANSRFEATIEKMKSLHKKYPQDWQKAREEMAEEYYYDEPIESRTIWNANLNGAAGILALLYGEGDFQRTLDLACAMGFDADNQAATMSGLLAIMNGLESIPEELLYPLEGSGWKKPFNDKYVNITRHDLPDSKISEMAKLTLDQAIEIIKQNGGEEITQNGKVYFKINTQGEFNTPMEFYKNPLPDITKGEKVNYTFNTSIPGKRLEWEITSGTLPPGLKIREGKLIGVAQNTGIYPVTIKVSYGDKSVTRTLQLLVKGKNLATKASTIVSNVTSTDTTFRDEMWLSVSQSLYADHVSVINDGNKRGKGSVFYSIDGSTKAKTDYYGYKWKSTNEIASVVFHLGSMEESGGWFESLNVEYLDDEGGWQSVKQLRISPNLMLGGEQFNKPNFVHYNLSFKPIKTKGIRIIGKAGNAEHWHNKPAHFTSITELEVYPTISK